MIYQLSKSKEAKVNTITTHNFSIIKPGGNDTALFIGIPNADKRKQLNNAIMGICPNIEQVGFINPDPQNAELMMAGGEFCGNATRAAAWQVLKGEPGDIEIKVSGVEGKLKAGVTQEREAYAQMPVYSDASRIQQDPEISSNYTVSLEGITHYIDFNTRQIEGLTADELKEKAFADMQARDLDKEAAAGIIYTEKQGDSYKITPVVYVKDIDTLFVETACGSGTAALGLVIAKQKGKSIDKVPILQPSGLPIKVSVDYDGKSVGYTQIQSSVEILQEGTYESNMVNKNIQKSIENLEKEMVTFADLLKISVQENNELFIKLDPNEIPNEYSYKMPDMKSITGPRILIRQGVYKLLLAAQKLLKAKYPYHTLFVSYGYRSLEIQTEAFIKQLRAIKKFSPNPYDLYEEAHRFIAVPTVSGHPTGGAIDIIIKDEKTNSMIDFGSEQYNYKTKDCYVFTKNITKEQLKNRLLLREVLLQVGFAPFNGEWWHFSYGDREWAFYYKKPHAIYSQILYEDIRQ